MRAGLVVWWWGYIHDYLRRAGVSGAVEEGQGSSFSRTITRAEVQAEVQQAEGAVESGSNTVLTSWCGRAGFGLAACASPCRR